MEDRDNDQESYHLEDLGEDMIKRANEWWVFFKKKDTLP